jgi:long-chain fatty acid transport protein
MTKASLFAFGPVVAVGVGLGATAHANAFLLNEFDARETGRGNAAAASDDEPSSIYYNVGGLAIGDGTRVQVSGSLVTPFATFNQTGGTSTDSNTSPQVLPAVFASHRITEMFSAGVGFYTPFGSAISWPDDAPTLDVVHTESLRSYFITPAVGANLGTLLPGLSVGAGIDLVPATFEITKNINFGSDHGTADLGATAFGVGGRIGAMYRVPSLPQLSFGVMWRSSVKLDFSGTGNFDAPAPFRSQLPPDGPITSTIKLPQQWTAGVAYRPLDQLQIEANLVWTDWSVFKSLDISVPANAPTGTQTLSTQEGYTNTFTVRVGGEYWLPDLGLGLRAGFIYDPTPIPSQFLTPALPDVDRSDLTVGATKELGNIDVSVALLWVLPTTRATATGDATTPPEYKGTFDVSAFVASLTIGGHVGTGRD